MSTAKRLYSRGEARREILVATRNRKEHLIQNLSFPEKLDHQQHGGCQMKAKIEYIDRPGQVAVFEHDDFFDHMRHGAKGRQQHKGCDKNQNRIGYAVKYSPHVDI